MITISGTAASKGLSGSMNESGVVIAAYKNSDENTVVAMTTTDASGNYSLTVPTDGVALDGYLKATKSGFIETYLYPPAPLTADFGSASINMITSGNRDLAYNITGVSQGMDVAFIALIVSDGTNGIAGATITTDPATTYRYNGTNGLPAPISGNNASTSTQADGIAYALNVPPGEITLNATKSGLTFKSHAVKARAPWA